MDSASSYGGYSYFASVTWLEIKGTNLADPADPRFDGCGQSRPVDFDRFQRSERAYDARRHQRERQGQAGLCLVSFADADRRAVPEDTSTGKVSVSVTNCKATSAPFQFQRQTLAPGFLAPSNYSAGFTQYMWLPSLRMARMC